MRKNLNWEAAADALDDFLVTNAPPDRLEAVKLIVAAAHDSEPVYQEPPRCLHQRLLVERDQCAICGAVLIWVVEMDTERVMRDDDVGEV